MTYLNIGLTFFFISLVNIGISSRQSTSCYIVETKREVQLDASKFVDHKEYIEDFYKSDKEVDVLLFEIVSGGTNKNTFKRVFYEEDGLNLIDTKLKKSKVDSNDTKKIQKLVDTISTGNHTIACEDYSSLAVHTIFMLKLKGKFVFSITYNVDDLERRLSDEEVAKRSNELELIKLIRILN